MGGYASDPDYADYMISEGFKANKLKFDSEDQYWEYVENKVIERIKARDKQREEDYDKLQEELKIEREAAEADRIETAKDIDRQWRQEQKEKNEEAWREFEEKEFELSSWFYNSYKWAIKNRKRPQMSKGEFEKRINELKRIRIGKITGENPDEICRSCLGDKMNFNVMRECQACVGTGKKMTGGEASAIRRQRRERDMESWRASQEMWEKRRKEQAEERAEEKRQAERKKLEKARRLASGCFDEEGNETFC